MDFINSNDDTFNNAESFEREALTLIDSLTDELLLENIYEQIRNSINIDNGNNYIETFETRYNTLITRYEETELGTTLKATSEEFYNNINNELNKEKGIQSNIDLSINKLIIKTLYEFFVLDYKENLINFLFNYIYRNKKSIIANYEDDKKTVDYISLKKILKNKSDIIILSNLYSIVNDISNMDIDYKDLIQTIIEDDPSEMNNYILHNLLVKKEFTDKIFIEKDFVSKFLLPLRMKQDGYAQVISKLQFKIYNSSIKKED